MPRRRAARPVGAPRSARPPGRAPRRARAGADVLGGDQVEGRQAVRELLRAGTRAVDAVHVVFERDPAPIVAEIVDLAEARGVLRFVDAYEIEQMARSDVPQGVVARAEPVAPVDLAALVTGEAPPFLVVFDGVTDPHNLGAMLRSALSLGATGAVLARHRSVHLTPVVAKAAAGAIEHLPIALVPGVPTALGELKASGVWTVGLDAEGDRPVDDLPVASEPVALVFGAEGRGLSPLSRARCEVLARIDLAGPLESLNVSAAAAVACFAVSRARSRVASV